MSYDFQLLRRQGLRIHTMLNAMGYEDAVIRAMAEYRGNEYQFAPMCALDLLSNACTNSPTPAYVLSNEQACDMATFKMIRVVNAMNNKG